MKRFLMLVMVMTCAAAAHAITVDGTLDAEYGVAISVQAINTQFGETTQPVLNGSELDAAYAKIEGGRLYLMFTGNHEPNFNKLNIFFDSVAGGESTLSDVPEYDFFNATPANGFQWISRNLGGMTFDTGFNADYHLFSRWGGTAIPNSPGPYEADFVNRMGGVSAMVPGSSGAAAAPAVGLVSTGFIPANDVGTNATVTALTQNLEFAANASNGGGVVAGSGAANQVDAAAVTTGMEFSVALADLGNPGAGSTILIAAMISNGDHNYLSNQILGPFTLPQHNPGGNGSNHGDGLGDPNNAGGFTGTMVGMNFNNFAGQQYFSLVVPASGLDGDYNHDGKVDAADYVVWRKTDGGNQAGYDLWRLNFGMGGGGSGLGSSSVPEPAVLLLAIAAGFAACGLVRRR